MRTLIEILAGLAILANAVIYGTDVFGAIVSRCKPSHSPHCASRSPRRDPQRGQPHREPDRPRQQGVT